MKLLIYSLLLASLFVSSPAAVARRHRHGYQPHPELCEIKLIWVEGNSESANFVRKDIPKRTWMALAASAKTADAAMKVSEVRSEKNFPIRTERVTVSAEIEKPDGTLIWSGSESFDEGVFNSGAGSAADILVHNIRDDAGCGNKNK